jgi:hypothetical protein
LSNCYPEKPCQKIMSNRPQWHLSFSVSRWWWQGTFRVHISNRLR